MTYICSRHTLSICKFCYNCQNKKHIEDVVIVRFLLYWFQFLQLLFIFTWTGTNNISWFQTQTDQKKNLLQAPQTILNTVTAAEPVVCSSIKPAPLTAEFRARLSLSHTHRSHAHLSTMWEARLFTWPGDVNKDNTEEHNLKCTDNQMLIKLLSCEIQLLDGITSRRKISSDL